MARGPNPRTTAIVSEIYQNVIIVFSVPLQRHRRARAPRCRKWPRQRVAWHSFKAFWALFSPLLGAGGKRAYGHHELQQLADTSHQTLVAQDSIRFSLMLTGITRQLGNEEFLFSCVVHQSYCVFVSTRVSGRGGGGGEGGWVPGE